MIERLLAHLASLASADAAMIASVGPTTARIESAHGLDLTNLDPAAVSAAAPFAEVVARRTLVTIDDARARTRASGPGEIDAGSPRWTSFAGWPIEGGDGHIDRVLAVMSDEPGPWKEDALEFGTDIAHLLTAAYAVEARVAHLEAVVRREREARIARRRLQRLAVASVGASTINETADAIVANATELLRASLTVLALPEGDNVRFVHSASVPQEVQEAWRTAPADTPVPIVQVLKPDATWIELRDQAAMAEWPLLVHDALRAGIGSFLALPLRNRVSRTPIAALGVGFDGPLSLDDTDRMLLAELTELASDALERTRAMQHSAEMAETLQRSLLPPRIINVSGLRVRALYLPATHAARVGGDWYDVVPTPGDGVAFVVGDVAGHDIRAAAQMGQIRHVLASQLAAHGNPAQALANTDRYFHALHEETYATAIVLAMTNDRSRVVAASAGHPAPLVAAADGVSVLAVPPGAPIGSGFGGYRLTEADLPSGAALVAFTDGLIERRGHPLDERLTEFAGRLASTGATGPAEIVAVIREQLDTPGRTDDAAVLVIKRDDPM